MEDPTTFDVFGTVKKGEVSAARSLLAELLSLDIGPELTRSLMRSAAQNEQILLAADLGYEALKRVQTALSAACEQLVAYQGGYTPADRSHLIYCDIHGIFYGGCLGCPVCTGRV